MDGYQAGLPVLVTDLLKRIMKAEGVELTVEPVRPVVTEQQPNNG